MELLRRRQAEVNLLPEPEVTQVPGPAPDELRGACCCLVVDVQAVCVRVEKVDVEHQLQGCRTGREGRVGEGEGPGQEQPPGQGNQTPKGLTLGVASVRQGPVPGRRQAPDQPPPPPHQLPTASSTRQSLRAASIPCSEAVYARPDGLQG